MESADADRQAEMSVTAPDGNRRNRRDYGDGASRLTARTDNPSPQTMQMIEAVVERENMMAALRRVEANKGSAGVDEMTVESLRPYLQEHWPRIKEQLLAGRYVPSPVRRVDIPKPNCKGMRQLGIPTVIDRLIQQALHQVMQVVFDCDFSKFSYGFRPGRSAHHAVLAARGRNLATFITELRPILRGWVNYFRLAEVKGVFEELDGWIRRKLRCILWRQWKRTVTRAKNLMRRGLDDVRAWKSATNGRGPWWNSGASHMHACYPKSYFDKLGFVSLLNQLQRLQCTI